MNEVIWTESQRSVSSDMSQSSVLEDASVKHQHASHELCILHQMLLLETFMHLSLSTPETEQIQHFMSL